MLSSSVLVGKQKSCISNHPPGSRAAKLCLKNFGQSSKLAVSILAWIRSNFWGYVQSCSRSSISHLQFGGAYCGCIALRSTPMTLHSGCRSAKSVAQLPVPVPISRQERKVSGAGQRRSLFWKVKLNSWCCRSRRLRSSISLGRIYLPSLYFDKSQCLSSREKLFDSWVAGSGDRSAWTVSLK